MSEKRWYYTDPLAAAWMAKHFGMRFEWTEPYKQGKVSQGFAYEMPFIHDMVDDDKMNSTPSKYHIHPDSLHLLNPTIGDLIAGLALYQDGPGWHIFSIGGDEDLQLMNGCKNYRIIQRGGVPFMWPESEAA